MEWETNGHQQNKELEASEERKRKAKQLEMQRKEAARSSRGAAPRAPNYPAYTPPARPSVPETFDSYEAEKKKTFAKYVDCFFIIPSQRTEDTIANISIYVQAAPHSWQGHAAWQEVQGDRYL